MPLLLLAVMTVPGADRRRRSSILGNADEMPLEYTSYAVHLAVVVVIFVATQAPQSVSRDLRFRVVALYFSRPLSRHGYVQAKLAAMSAAIFVLLAVPLLVLYAGALLAQLPLWTNTRDLLAGLAGAVLFAVVLARWGCSSRPSRRGGAWGWRRSSPCCSSPPESRARSRASRRTRATTRSPAGPG